MSLVSYCSCRYFVNRRYFLNIPKIINQTLNYSKTKEPVDYAEIPVERIRNFSIIAHVDHGKSTLADRLLEYTGTIQKGTGQPQFLDKLQVERERGITVKAQSVSLLHDYQGETYLLNLIDTPGHVDFSNEVSRSLSACQGVILLIDANDGVQAQTVANFYLAFGSDLVIIPVLNKIDLKNANPERVCLQMKNLFEIEANEVLKISAKLGIGIEALLEAIIERLPSPIADRNAPFKALLYDSWYHKFRGAVSLVYVKEGSIKVGNNITFCHTNKSYEVKRLALLRPDEEDVDRLVAGQIGVISCSMKSSQEAHMGDTIHLTGSPVERLPGFKKSQPMVFAGIFPFQQSEHVQLRGAVEKLALNDPAVTVAIESSPALGQGWRLGFLGLLHLEVFSQRLQQEYGAETILTAPSVTYKIQLKESKKTLKEQKDTIFVSNPAHFPDPQTVESYYEPIVRGTVITPDKYLGPVLSLCIEKRGIQKSATNIDNDRVLLEFDLPLNEIIMDFHDSLKTISSGYASFDYEDGGYQETNVVKMSILLNGVSVDELSCIVHVSKARTAGKHIVYRLKDLIPRQMISIAVQAVANGKVLARENIKPYRKDVTAKLYGGDVTRKMKLLAQQAAGKKKMKSIANISVPRDAFIEYLKR